MRSSLSICALSLALLQVVDALGGARSRRFGLMAEMGLLPDGTPMQVSTEAKAALRLALSEMPPPIVNGTEKILPEYVELPLDHFAKNHDYSYQGTFNNRFWVRESAYKSGGPVFIYDVGEADAEPNALFRLQNETSFFKQLVDKYNGVGIVWEHRYYGNSTPGGIDVNTPPEVFRWLTTEQSLADVDRFAKQFKRKNIKNDLTPSKTPWIFVGGSYPAMRAAFMRDKYPDTIFASYASSAPVEAQVDMSVYFEPVWRGMNTYGYGNCTKDIKAAVQYMDKIMENPTAASKLKERFLGLGAGKNSNPTFADALTTPFNLWQSYGIDGGAYGLRLFCDYLSTDPQSNKTSGADGWAASKGANFTVNRWASYPRFPAMVNDYLDTNCSGSLTKQGDCDLNLKFSDPAMVAWTWQYCTQWGFLQSANLGPHQLVSKYNSLEHQKDICHRQFPTAKPPLFPIWPDTKHTNDVFGGWDIRPSQVYWSGGEFDPWRTLSPLSAESFAPHPKTFQNPPKCGEEQGEDEIFGYVIPGAQHCYDFRTTFAGGAVSRGYFTAALDRWLKCFRPRHN
ncbi:serine carboxypeptidase S28-domain-containing protein [Clohesyomyces aquaticus]|uniref:Serine carboxypeptidase S28-domain-containing protein n=1 Tax=Clohesyomyces aquaticus TaxID=1231657 RepID=A0A1Y1ZEF5_9PLEO|nr:serine carboxypeptidase S28-domain-containing protein [Clohesyomyces aquaticus]